MVKDIAKDKEALIINLILPCTNRGKVKVALDQNPVRKIVVLILINHLIILKYVSQRVGADPNQFMRTVSRRYIRILRIN